MAKIKRNDEVIVIAGRDKGKQGTVQKVLSSGKLIVSGINKVKKHQKPNPQMQIPGGIIDKEAPIEASNVAIWNSGTGKADRVAFRILDEGVKVRVFKSNNEKI